MGMEICWLSQPGVGYAGNVNVPRLGGKIRIGLVVRLGIVRSGLELEIVQLISLGPVINPV